MIAEFARIKARNSRMTLRALARRLELSPGRLSEFLSGKRRITVKTAQRISERLALDPARKHHFLRTIGSPGRAGRASESPTNYHLLALDQFALIADWYHYAILSLTEIKGFKSKEEWIAKRLGISTIQVRAALQRLVRVGLLKVEDGRWVTTGRNLETPSDIASSALRRSHRQDLKRAMRALDEVALEERDITAMTMAIDVRRLPEAKRRIREFRKDMARFLEHGEANEVYNLNIQLIPLTEKTKEENS